jgi:hypothetical protein
MSTIKLMFFIVDQGLFVCYNLCIGKQEIQMYKITAEHMSQARGARVVVEANAQEENIIYWAKDEIFEGFYTFYFSPGVDLSMMMAVQDLVYKQNGGNYAPIIELTAEQAEEFE